MSIIALIMTATNAVLNQQEGSPSSQATIPECQRRAHERYDISGSLTVLARDGMKIASGRLADMSAGGIGFYVPIQLQPQQYVTIEFQTKVLNLRVSAFIVARDPVTGKYGARFVGISESTRGMITESLRLSNQLRQQSK